VSSIYLVRNKGSIQDEARGPQRLGVAASSDISSDRDRYHAERRIILSYISTHRSELYNTSFMNIKMANLCVLKKILFKDMKL